MNLGNEKKGKIIIEGLSLYYCLEGTQAKDTKFVYNDIKNITKESVKLHNSYRSNQNTDETIHANGNFSNVNEVHNNTGTMTLSGFNQEGGKVTGNIGKVEVTSRQNTSTTTGSSKGVNLGISANGVPSSVTINASRTNGNRAFVDNQSTFVVGEGSNLHVGTVENTGAVIGKDGNSTFRIDTYAGKNIQNYDTMTTTGGSIGASLGGKPKITNVGFNQDSRDKQGITRNTVVGDVEIAEAEGSPINRDLGKANEVTKDTHSRTNINVESQTIEYLTNPGKLKEDIGKAKEEINDIKWAIKESIHDRGDDNRNFFGQLSEVRLDKSLENITGERLIGKTVDTEIAGIFKDAYKDLGYDINIIFSDPKNSPQLLDEKGLESTGRASNEYFSEKYKDDNPTISIHSDGKDYSNVDFGENVGDAFLFKRLVKMEYSVYYKYAKTTLKSLNNDVDKLLKLYGVTEKETLSVAKANELRGFYADAAESALVGQLTGGSTLWVKITIGTLYFFSSRNDSVSSVALSNEVKEKNALIYVAAIEEDRKGLAEKTYYGEHNSLYPFYYNYSRGKLPTQTELNKYNKVKHSNYSMQQIKTRLWKLFNYQKTRNPDYYVKPRRVELLPEIKNLWESGK